MRKNIFSIIVIFTAFILLFFTPPKTQAAGNWIGEDIPKGIMEAVINKTANLAGTDFYSLSAVFTSLGLFLGGVVPGVTAPANVYIDNPEYANTMNNQSALGSANRMIASIYQNKPVDLSLWIKDAGQTLGFVPKQAHAQGVGFKGLAAVLPIWKAFRNISYLFLAIVMVAIGFMVMFRKKIDPKTVVTVQNALPNIVITMLLITFSYAIAGLMIDIMYLVIIFGVNILVPLDQGIFKTGLFKADQNTASQLMTGNMFTLLGQMIWGATGAFDDLLRYLIAGNPQNWLQGLGAVGAGVLATPFIVVILAVAILFGYIRIIFLLGGAYINIIISVIFAPLLILMDAIPGNQSFVSWFNNLLADLAVFPITIILLLIGLILTGQNQVELWNPPLVGITSTATNANAGALGLIGLGMLFIIPTIAGNLKEALKAKAAIDAGPGAITGPMWSGATQAMQLMYQLKFINPLGGGHAGAGMEGTTTLGRSMAAQGGKSSGH